MKRVVSILMITIIVMTQLIVFANGALDENGIRYFKAKVLTVNQTSVESDEVVKGIYIVKIELSTGEIAEIEHSIMHSDAFPIYLKAGDHIVAGVSKDQDGNKQIFIHDYQRDHGIYVLIVLFVLVILWVGKWQGVKTILTLFITLSLIRFVHIPLLLRGVNPILVTILIVIIATTITIGVITGRSKKSIAAITGTIAGVILAGVISFIASHLMHVTGLSNEEAVMLKYIPQGDIFNASELLLSGIILGSLGAVMDVAMSISSSIEEMHSISPQLHWKKLYQSGINIGRDIMGTMTNTLILAYVGSALPLVLLFSAYNMSSMRVMNMDIIATEVVRSLSGSIGIVLCIPITAIVSIILNKKMAK